MAELEKYTDGGVMMLLKHSDRQIKNDSNKDIVEERKDLNYSIDMERNGLSPRDFYKQIKDSSYLYGRGSQREAEAVTCCSWVITLPKSISDYTTVGKDEIKILNSEAERAFFEGVNQFVSDRYETVFYNRVHYDEGGQPHIHIYFVPQTKLDHDLVHYKTTKTHEVVRTESGRYEFTYRFKLENGERIPLKNYAKMSDYYDTKISGADVLNKAELQHFHGDLAEHLRKNNLPGADSVYSGKTDGKNISVKSLKEFTKATGITIDGLKENPLSKDELSELLDKTELKSSDRCAIEAINSEATIEKLQTQIHKIEAERAKAATLDKSEELAHKDRQIRELSHTIYEKNQVLSEAAERNIELEKKLAEMEKTMEAKQEELERAQARVQELEKEKTIEASQTDKTQVWGQATSSWGDKSQSGWGTKFTSFEQENKEDALIDRNNYIFCN